MNLNGAFLVCTICSGVSGSNYIVGLYSRARGGNSKLFVLVRVSFEVRTHIPHMHINRSFGAARGRFDRMDRAPWLTPVSPSRPLLTLLLAGPNHRLWQEAANARKYSTRRRRTSSSAGWKKHAAPTRNGRYSNSKHNQYERSPLRGSPVNSGGSS